MTKRHTSLPSIWLVSDARNDAVLEATLKHLPRGSGLIFRHYHLPPVERRERFAALARIARARGHLVYLAGTARQARRWGADGSYGSGLATAHSFRELRRIGQSQAVLLSPVYATRSHPNATPLGPLRFRLLAAHSPVPVIALGGMNARTARRLGWRRWAAIDAFLQFAARTKTDS